jgi:hypothetical protein
MAAVDLLLDEPAWQHIGQRDKVGPFPRIGRLRVWRGEPDRLIAMVSDRAVMPGVPWHLGDDDCVIPDQIRARFPDHDIDIFAYEHGWWGDQARYFRAGRADDGSQRWALVDWAVLNELLGEALVYDEDEDTTTGAG